MKFNIGTYSFGMDTDLSLAGKFKTAKEIVDDLTKDFKA